MVPQPESRVAMEFRVTIRRDPTHCEGASALAQIFARSPAVRALPFSVFHHLSRWPRHGEHRSRGP